MITLSVSTRRGLAAVGLAAAAATAAGCGSSGGTTASQSPAPSSAASSGAAGASAAPGPSTPATAPSSRSSGASGPAMCATSALLVSLASNQAGGAAGSTYVPINFTNTSGAACIMYGYPGVSFVSGLAGSQIGAPAKRAPNVPSVSVTVAAHATAHAWLQVAQAGNYPAATCHPVTAHWLKVYPPGNTVASSIDHSFPACSSAKVTILTVMPVRTGAGAQGQVP